jgi:hypothetical protein
LNGRLLQGRPDFDITEGGVRLWQGPTRLLPSPRSRTSSVLDGKALSADEIKKLADLESREVLLAKLAGALKAKPSQAAAVFQALPSKLVRTVDALRDKVEQGGAGTPAPAEDAE